jgi:hypothetical protein
MDNYCKSYTHRRNMRLALNGKIPAAPNNSIHRSLSAEYPEKELLVPACLPEYSEKELLVPESLFATADETVEEHRPNRYTSGKEGRILLSKVTRQHTKPSRS